MFDLLYPIALFLGTLGICYMTLTAGVYMATELKQKVKAND